MAITVDDFSTLLRILDEHPEWREELRRRVLDDEFLRLPEYVLQNSRDIAQNSRDIAQNSLDIASLTRAIKAMEEKFDKQFERVYGGLENIERWRAEEQWSCGFAGRFGSLVTRARLVTPADLSQFEDATDDGTITVSEAYAVRRLDLIITGTIGKLPDRRNVVLAVEISTRIEENDVVRALDRAAILRKAGYDSVPVVAGSEMDLYLQTYAAERGVEVFIEG